ncbi:hypothetical protein [Enterococcus faecium]|uniref:hypothetical protein n=1 Tax=Enterococcus faecium TaxID=1352 RepID=UPI001F4605B6|nr:hypothetical protein [Enterococcus faecium]MCF8636718.1 hypothetical protein [Enterococcus faecium]HAQ5747097.1 hypothetical protein [Enterococcus faecium]
MKSKAKELMQEGIREHAQLVYEEVIEKYHLPYNIKVTQRDIPVKIAEEQTDMGLDELLDWLKEEEATENILDNKVQEYVQQNYDDSFLQLQIERKIEVDKIKEMLVDEMVLWLDNTEPYVNVGHSYWMTKANSVQSIAELGEYLVKQEDGLAEFVENYAPDWEEVKEENKN